MKFIEQFCHSNSLKISAVVKFIKRFYSFFMIAFLLLVSHVILWPHYGTNDDPTFKLLLSGKLLPNFPAVKWTAMHGNLFANSIYALYKNFPSIPWYDLSLLFCILTSAFIVFNLAKKRYQDSGVLFGMISVFLIMLLFPVFCGYQFTIETTLLAGSAMLWLIDLLFISNNTQKIKETIIINKSKIFLIGIFLIISLSIRFESAIIGIVLCSCIYGIHFVTRKENNSKVIPLSICLLSVLVFSLGLKLIDKALETPEEKEFIKENKARLAVSEYAAFKKKGYPKWDKRQIKSLTGYSYNDYIMLRSWFFTNPKFKAENLKPLLKFQQERYPTYKKLSYNFFPDFVRVVLFYFVAIVLIGLFFRTVSYLEISLSVLLLLFMFAGITYLTKEPPPRVYIPMFLLTILSFMFLPSKPAEENLSLLKVGIFKGLPKRQVFDFFIIFILLLEMSLPSIDTCLSMRKQHPKVTKVLNKVLQVHNPKYIMSVGSGVPHEMIFPVYWNEAENKFRIVSLGMYSQSPWFKSFLKRENLYDNFELKICSDDRILIASDEYFLARSGYENLKTKETSESGVFTKFMRENYGVNVAFEEQKEPRQKKLKLYKCKIVPYSVIDDTEDDYED